VVVTGAGFDPAQSSRRCRTPLTFSGRAILGYQS
jgi:hypothetical protein